jgi:hypothetical protein
MSSIEQASGRPWIGRDRGRERVVDEPLRPDRDLPEVTGDARPDARSRALRALDGLEEEVHDLGHVERDERRRQAAPRIA